ncbi:hypothetical protein JCM8202_004227 [Rhodotorula sphaerocarpa]
MAPKRPASNAGSPPPANGDKAAAPPKAKKPRAPRPRKPKKSAAAAAAANAAAGGSAAGSPPPGTATGSAAASPMPPGASSPPVSPSAGAGRGGSVLLRDGSVAPKGKERADTAQPDGSGGMDGAGPAEQEEQDAEDEVFEFSDDEFGDNQAEAARQKEDLRVLLEHFDENQMDRYEAYRRSGLTKNSVRRLVNSVLQQSVSPSILTVVRGFAKVFVGEIVEKACELSDHPGPLTPQDLREAYRIYLQEHEGPGAGGSSHPKKLFVR